MIKVSSTGDFSKTFKFLNTMSAGRYLDHVLNRYGAAGVAALKSVTPKDTGKTADSWRYTVQKARGSIKIIWSNDNVTGTGVPIVVLLQYGHGTGNGGYVQGIDFINPAIKPIFDKIAEEAWREVSES